MAHLLPTAVGFGGHRVDVSYTAEGGICTPAVRLSLWNVNTFLKRVFPYISVKYERALGTSVNTHFGTAGRVEFELPLL